MKHLSIMLILFAINIAIVSVSMKLSKIVEILEKLVK